MTHFHSRSGRRVSVRKLSALLPAICLLAAGGQSSAEDWPCFLGPRHDGTSAETTVSPDWPDSGPKVLWKQEIGTGYGAPSILGDRLVVHHREGDTEIVSCRSVTNGSEVWQYSYPSAFSDPYGYNNGPRCSPVLSGDRCYTLGAEGMLACVNLSDGSLIWKHALSEEFDLPDWFFGMGCSPVLDGERLIVLVGGQNNSGVVAFDKNDGRVLWKAVGKETWDGVTDMHTGEPYEWSGNEMVVSYSSPVIAEIHGKRHLLCLMRQGLVSLDPETGKQNFRYWFRPKVHESVNAAVPVVIGDRIFLSAAYRLGSVLLQVSADGTACEPVWRSETNMLAHWSTPIHVDGFLYGFSGRHENEGELRCIRVSDGEVVWSTTGFEGDLSKLGRDVTTGQIVNRETKKPVPFPYFGRGSLLQIGSRFVALGERGTLAVVRVDPKSFREERRTFFDEIGYPAWAAPVLSNGLLYLRSENHLLCVDLR
ncbi:MAG: PQQ-binding-like beta-propeller repeat protein [Planctomycetaceae bacterium]|nr:PQQ-binding-like beta-propeller repeat protein [Planctomycetaceae bacterium]